MILSGEERITVFLNWQCIIFQLVVHTDRLLGGQVFMNSGEFLVFATRNRIQTRARTMALRMFRVAIVGTPSSVLSGTSKGVGKSCLCNRFIHPDNYCEEHSSRISSEDWTGNVVSSDHFIYWGATTKFNAQTGRVRFQLVEFTEFVHEDSGFVFPFEADYIRRACGPIDCPGKVAYVPPPQEISEANVNLVNEESSSSVRLKRKGSSVASVRSLLEEGKTSVSGYVCVFDPTLPDDNGLFRRQIEFLRHLLDEISKLKKPLVIACTKCDHTEATKEKINKGKALLLNDRKKKNIFFIESSARDNVNIDEVFFALVVSMNRRKTLGPSFVRKNVNSYIDVSTYREVEWQRRKQLKLARSDFQVLLENKVTRFDTYWEETKPQLEKEPEFQRLVDLEGEDIVRKMFCNRLMEVKLLEATLKYEQNHSAPPTMNGSSWPKDCGFKFEDRMKYSQTALKEAVASHPDLDVSSLYEFVRPQPEDQQSSPQPQQPLPTVDHLEEDDPNGFGQSLENGEANGHVLQSVSHGSEVVRSSQDETAQDEESARQAAFRQRSKSYIFTRNKKVKNATSSTVLGKSPSDVKELSTGEFWTLPRRKKKGNKKEKMSASKEQEQKKLSNSQISFEDNGQYTEENPPPLPPRPQELPPIQKRPVPLQSKDNHGDEHSATNGFHYGASKPLQSRSSSCSCLLDNDDEPGRKTSGHSDSNFPPENASPYEVPQVLLASAPSKGNNVRATLERSPDKKIVSNSTANLALHGSFRSEGFGRVLGDIIAQEGKQRTGRYQRTHRRGGSYDQSLLTLVKHEVSPPRSDLVQPGLVSTQPSHVYPDRGHHQPVHHGSDSVPSALGPPPVELHASGSPPRSQKNGRPLPPKQANLPPPLPPPPSGAFGIRKASDTHIPSLETTNFHSRQASLPDFFDSDHKPIPPERRIHPHTHNGPSAGSDDLLLNGEYVGKLHPLMESLTTNPPPPPCPPARGSQRATSELMYTPSSRRQSVSKSSSEEREYAVILRNTADEETSTDGPSRRGALAYTVKGRKTSHRLSEDCVYEQIDDDMIKNIIGKTGIPMLSSSFPKPLFPHNFSPDKDTILQIQQWHLEFLHFYQYWLRGLDRIVESSLLQGTGEYVTTSSSSEQCLPSASTGDPPPAPPPPPTPSTSQPALTSTETPSSSSTDPNFRKNSDPSVPPAHQAPAQPTHQTTTPPTQQIAAPPTEQILSSTPLEVTVSPSVQTTILPTRKCMDSPTHLTTASPTHNAKSLLTSSTTAPPTHPTTSPPTRSITAPPTHSTTAPPIVNTTIHISSVKSTPIRPESSARIHVPRDRGSMVTQNGTHQTTAESGGLPSPVDKNPVVLRKPVRSAPKPPSLSSSWAARMERLSVDSVLDTQDSEAYDRLTGYQPKKMGSEPNLADHLHSKKSSLV